jgi:hypothetical protein
MYKSASVRYHAVNLIKNMQGKLVLFFVFKESTAFTVREKEGGRTLRKKKEKRGRKRKRNGGGEVSTHKKISYLLTDSCSLVTTCSTRHW